MYIMTDLHAEFDDALAAVKEEIEKVLSKAPRSIQKYTAHLSKAGGKLIRGASLLACAADADDKIPAGAVPLAAAIEILHLATLVHDDVIDDADIRRGIPTVSRHFGRKAAVLCGDYLFCVALKLASRGAAREAQRDWSLADYMSRICLGEVSQFSNNGNLDLSILAYLRIISGKTAALFEAAFLIGAELAYGQGRTTRAYKRIGRYIGMIFQLRDDCIDFESTREEALKNVRSDYEQGVITLPLIHALNALPALKERAQNAAVTRRDIQDGVQKTGGLKASRRISSWYYQKAKTLLDSLEMNQSKRVLLSEILNNAGGFAFGG